MFKFEGMLTEQGQQMVEQALAIARKIFPVGSDVWRECQPAGYDALLKIADPENDIAEYDRTLAAIQDALPADKRHLIDEHDAAVGSRIAAYETAAIAATLASVGR